MLRKKKKKTLDSSPNLCYTTPMITRRDQIEAALLCAAIDTGFKLTINRHTGEIIVKDLHGQADDFAIEFSGDGFEDLDVKALDTIENKYLKTAH